VTARRWRIVDAVYVAALMLYVLAGVALVPFHGDEPMQIYFSGDYEVAVLQGNPSALTTRPPYDIDSDPQLRILNGSVNRYLIGLSRQIAGIGADQLPPRPGWDWGLTYDRNVETNHRPSDALIMAGRWPSAILLALCAPLAFGLGWLVGKRPGAYLLAGLILLNPVILLNGRRAMQEGALLFFGMAVVLTAAWMARRRSSGQRVSPWWWALLALMGGLALTSKHSALPFIGGALAWIFLGELTHFRLKPFLKTAGALALSGVLMAGLFFALSPALWDDPATRFSDLLKVRATLLDIQVNGQPTSPEFRVAALFAMPYLAPPQYFEIPEYGGWEPIPTEIARYHASGLAGIPFDGALGGVVLGLTLAGMVFALWPKGRSFADWATAAGLFAWWGVTALSLLVNPLNWQRYYLALIPPTAAFATVGVLGLWLLARRLWARRHAG
jgi:cbb3-type cytochrome oxidase subunit 3